ncbi:carbamoyltransferase HypF [Marichromatium sp. AB32]|nr:carbamoyltransferase HypF [Marichromatium sp. AB32]
MRGEGAARVAGADGSGAPAESIRVRGQVQGVGFRPTVWRLARDCALVGDVRNDGEGVLIRARPGAGAPPEAIARFCARLRAECPPLAQIERIERAPLADPAALAGVGDFVILASADTPVHTAIVPDAATCSACAAEVRDPANRRHRYPFTNCTHCGPRLSIVESIPYDRANTSMAHFPLCPACAREYADPADRRFHAQPNACPVCGPRVWLAGADGRALEETGADPIAAASARLAAGEILAIKGIGGFHLACDAGNDRAVAELRRRKRRPSKPFALMARDLAVVRRHCLLAPGEAETLASPAAPIVLLARRADGAPLAEAVAPGQSTLGILLPYSPLHLLLLAEWTRPLVMTSGNRAGAPQCIDNDEALQALAGIADAWLLHDRDIRNRVDDSVVRTIAARPRLLRRARGHAPGALVLPPGLARGAATVALGGELKNTLCLGDGERAILSQHLGDLEEAGSARAWVATLARYLALFEHRPTRIAIDAHPDYRASQYGRDWAARAGLALVEVQHHHAHIAALLAEHGRPPEAGPVLGIALDGLGWGEDGTLWGGELLQVDYRGSRRLGGLCPAALPGGARAMVEPWRNLLAQLERAGLLDAALGRWAALEAVRALAAQPLEALRTLIARGLNAPPSSSAGRLFDAVAAALGLAPARLGYEGEAAIAVETLAATVPPASEGYPFALDTAADGRLMIDPAPLWPALFDDLAAGTTPARAAARFHDGLIHALVACATRLCASHRLDTVALSGGVMQNRRLVEPLATALEAQGLQVLLHRRVPANDGGLALGQLCVARAREQSAP